MRTSALSLAVGLLILGPSSLVPHGTLAAQDPPSCDRGEIRAIHLDRHSVFDTQSRRNAWYTWALDAVNWLHPDTKAAFI